MTKQYWHFVREDKKLGYGDGRKIRRGSTLKIDPDKLKPCQYGLHASEKVLDALSYCYWKNSILCKVELGGTVIKSGDKTVASERKVIDYIDVTKVSRKFAVRVAEDVLPIFEKKYPEDTRVRDCIETTKKYLKGEVSLEVLIKARSAAAAAYAADAADAAAAYAAYAAAAYAAAAAAYAAYAAAYAAYAAADAADAAAAAADAADAADAAAAYAAAADAAVKKDIKEKYNTWLTEMVEAEFKKRGKQ